MDDARIAAALLALAEARGADRSFCPSEVARALAEDWRPLMPRIRQVAARLPLRATQKGAPVDPRTARGPIRLSRA
ncbi:MAG: DUF3253 domain-containing protein [Pseudomonadota bacterium]